MKRSYHLISLLSCFLLVLVSLSSCLLDDRETWDGTPQDVLEDLWKFMDEHYCFFDYKQQELGVDWNEVHSRYSAKINKDMSDQQLFEVLCDMLAELKDGHVNLYSSFDLGRNWSFYEDHPENYNDSIVNLYLGHDYQIASGLKYKVLDDNVGYVRCESFNTSIGSGNVSEMLYNLSVCTGLIVDVRGNGGGALTNAHTLASHFTNQKVLIGYTCHKTGKPHDAFSKPLAQYLESAKEGFRWQKPVVVITNRHCFSACNDFVVSMKQLPNVTVLGDYTGGGSGMPFNSELANGWGLRYSAVVSYDAEMHHTEFGVAPDVDVQMNGNDTDSNRDTLIEKARELLRKG